MVQVDKTFDEAVIICIMDIKEKIKVKHLKSSLVNFQAPTETKEDEVRNATYSDLERILISTPSFDIKIILMDFNAYIGNEKSYLRMNDLHNSIVKLDYSNVRFCRIVFQQ